MMKNPFGGGGMPMPWPMMMPWMQPEQPQQYTPDIVTPARAKLAMDYLAMCAQKTQDRAAVSESQIQPIDGQKLTQEEQVTQDSACQLLASYFDGKLKLDVWEKIRYDTMRKRAEMGGRECSILRCVICGHPNRPPNPNCELCKGSGRLVVMSFGGMESPSGDLDEEPPCEDTP